MSKISNIVQEIHDIKKGAIHKDTPLQTRDIYGKGVEDCRKTSYRNQMPHSSPDTPICYETSHSQTPSSPPSIPDQRSLDDNPSSSSRNDGCQTSGPRRDLKAWTAEDKRMTP
jgi:hypothetical protein